MIFIDTVYLLALVRANDELHERAVRWSDVLNEPLLVTEYVVWEFVNVCPKPQNRQLVPPILEWIEGDPGVVLKEADRELFTAGFIRFNERLDKAWSLTDCVSFIVMENAGVTQALTNDHHFEQAGFEALLRKEPPEA